jgi:hypothetical protein
MRQTPEFAGGVNPLWTSGDRVLGTTGLVSTSIPSGQTKGTSNDICPIVVGDFTNCVIGFWDTLELIVDPFGKKKSGMVELNVFATCDLAYLRPNLFTVIPDGRP